MGKTRIRELREAKGLAQDALGKILGVGQKTISQWELGICEPSIAMIKKLCAFFDVTSDYLLGITEI